MLNFQQADVTVQAALHRLKAPEMAPLLSFLNKQFEDTKSSLVFAEANVLTRMQGRAGYLKELLDAIEASASAVEKLRK